MEDLLWSSSTGRSYTSNSISTTSSSNRSTRSRSRSTARTRRTLCSNLQLLMQLHAGCKALGL